MAAWDLVYLAHVMLETVLGAMKLRGRYSHQPKGARTDERTAAYVRHHGFSLLAHALLGWLVWQRGRVHSETGRMASSVLALFHGGPVAAFALAWHRGAMPTAKILVPHAPFALLFAWHAAAAS